MRHTFRANPQARVVNTDSNIEVAAYQAYNNNRIDKHELKLLSLHIKSACMTMRLSIFVNLQWEESGQKFAINVFHFLNDILITTQCY